MSRVYNNRLGHTTGDAIAGSIGKWVCWRRPRSYWSVVVLHFPLALIFGAAMVLPYLTALNRLPMIPCTFLSLTGYPCPLCGFTRGFWAIANGHWSLAMANCPLAFLVYFFVAAMAIWHLGALMLNLIISRGPILRLGPVHRPKAVAAIICLFSLNWFYRLIMELT